MKCFVDAMRMHAVSADSLVQIAMKRCDLSFSASSFCRCSMGQTGIADAFRSHSFRLKIEPSKPSTSACHSASSVDDGTCGWRGCTSSRHSSQLPLYGADRRVRPCHREFPARLQAVRTFQSPFASHQSAASADGKSCGGSVKSSEARNSAMLMAPFTILAGSRYNFKPCDLDHFHRLLD